MKVNTVNILITGINGFVGKNIARYLMTSHNIIGVGTKDECVLNIFKYVKWNLAEEKIPQELLSCKIDVIIHAAASLSKNDFDENLIYTNCLGAHKIFTLCKECGCNLSILVSGVPIIGQPKEKAINEETSIQPLTMYHATKASQEMILNQLIKYGIKHVNLRVPSPIGMDMPIKTIVPIFVDKVLKNEDILLYGKGTREQNYIDVRDIANALELIIKNGNISGTYNIGAENTISNYNLARKCIELTNSKSQIKFADKDDPTDNQVWNIDCSKLKHDIGFSTKYTLDDTLKDIADFIGRNI